MFQWSLHVQKLYARPIRVKSIMQNKCEKGLTKPFVKFNVEV
jgi:hypothetical protein